MRSGNGRKVRVSVIHGLHAPTSAANFARSMLPPETTATIFSRRSLRRPRGRGRASAERGGDGAAGGAFGDDVRPLGDELHRPRHLVERDDDRAGQRRQQRPHRRQHRLAAGAVDERRLPVVEIHRPARRERGRRAARRFPVRRRRSACPGFSSRDRGGDAGEQPAAAERRDDRVDVGQVFENLETGRRVAGDEPIVVERMHEVAGHPIGAVRFDRAPAFIVGGADDRRAEPLDRADLRRRAPCPSP